LDTAKTDNYSQVTVSPGYRFNLNDNDGYIALSMDYSATDEVYSGHKTGVIDYEIYGRYYTDKSSFYGQYIIPNKDVTGYDYKYSYLRGAYKCSEDFSVGGAFSQATDYFNYYDIQCAVSLNRLGVELVYFNNNYDPAFVPSTDYYGSSANVLYSFTDNFRAGCQVTNYSDVNDPALFLKEKYNFNDRNSVVLTQRLKNDSYDAVTFLNWDIKFK
jgi:hypothetical protein